LVEGQTYVMHNFKILKNQRQYRVCEHPYKLLFIGATTIKPQEIVNVPIRVYNFKSIKEIVDGTYSTTDILIGKSIYYISLLITHYSKHDYVMLTNEFGVMILRYNWGCGQC